VTYNVGDPHVFFLPGHLCTALALSVLPGWRVPSWAARTAVFALLVYAGWRAWDTWPSATREGDRRADLLVARVATNLADTDAVILSDMDWQNENALLYSARYDRRTVAWRRLAEVLPHLPFLVRDNHAIGRDVVLAGNAAARVAAAYGSLFPLVPDGLPPSTLLDRAESMPRGTPFIMTLLEPLPGERFDTDDFDRALTALAGRAARRSQSRFQVWAGVAGEPGGYHREADRPFRDDFSVLGDSFSGRMESCCPSRRFDAPVSAMSSAGAKGF